jgi:hypothetical protein
MHHIAKEIFYQIINYILSYIIILLDVYTVGTHNYESISI